MSKQRGLLYKTLVIGVILLLLCMSITPTVAIDNVRKSTIPISDKSVIIVDDEGDGDYTSIKEAFLNVNSGDTIEVYSGKYPEGEILINKEKIVLKGIPYELGSGNDTGKPYLFNYSSNYIIKITANDVVLTRFKIENLGGFGDDGIRCYANFCSIINNEITDGYKGIAAFGNQNIIANNTISKNCSFCMTVKGKNCIITNNNLDTKGGISISQWSKNITISNNKINSLQHAILLESSENCVITGNRITSVWECGIKLEYSNLNKVFLNEFINSPVGIGLEYSTLNVIKQNNFINNLNHSYFFGGILFNRNRWINNYWDDRSGFGPYRINGNLVLFWILFIVYPFPIVISWSVFDWIPASQSHIIASGRDR